MVWVFPEYGGQVAVRSGDFKILRRQLKAKKPADWEVYHITQDRNETNNLAKSRPDLVELAKTILRNQTLRNEVFPLNWDLPDQDQ